MCYMDVLALRIIIHVEANLYNEINTFFFGLILSLSVLRE